MKMYVNCELKVYIKGSEYCIGCYLCGCYVMDINMLLMIGRLNYSLYFYCIKFDSGDIVFWEKYLLVNDVEMLCGVFIGELYYVLVRKLSKKRKNCNYYFLFLVDMVIKEVKRDSGIVNFIMV